MSNILYEAHPKLFRNNPLGFIITLALIPVFGLGILILLIWFISTRMEKLTVTEDDVQFTKGILSKDRTELSTSTIRSVRVRQGLIQRMFGTGNIEIYTAGDDPEILVKGMPDPHKVREQIRRKKEGYA